MRFELWIESEEIVGGDGGDFCNIQITVGGESYALNVWTFDYAIRLPAVLPEEAPDLDPPYLRGPDLLVESLKRPCLEKVVHQLITRGELDVAWRIAPHEVGSSRDDPTEADR